MSIKYLGSLHEIVCYGSQQRLHGLDMANFSGIFGITPYVIPWLTKVTKRFCPLGEVVMCEGGWEG